MAMESLKSLARRLGLGRLKPQSPWRTPVIVDRGALGEACIALDGQGFGSAIWENQGQLWTMAIGPGSAPAIVRLPLGEGTTPRIVLNADGRGMALWQCEGAGERQILGRMLGGDQETTHVVFRTGGRIDHLQGAVDRRGNALVVWLLEQDGRLEVMAQSFDTRGLAWERAPVTLGIPAAPAVEPRIAVNPKADAMVLWEAESSPSEGLVSSHYWRSESLWSDRPVPVAGHATRHHRVVMDDLGNALALWVHAPRGQRSTLVASFYDGLRSEWGAPEELSRAQVFSPPKLAMAGQGQALAAWCQAEGHGASRLITKDFRQGRWEPGVECLELGHGPVTEFDIDLGPEGQAALLAVHRGPEGDWVSARLRQRAWSAAMPWVPGAGAPCASPQIRLCPQGASAIWLQGRGSEMALALAETW